MTQQETRTAELILSRLVALSTPGSSVGVRDEVKEGVRLYVQTWLVPLARALSTPANLRTENDRVCLSMSRRG